MREKVFKKEKKREKMPGGHIPKMKKIQALCQYCSKDM
jgi:hypothetical protein